MSDFVVFSIEHAADTVGGEAEAAFRLMEQELRKHGLGLKDILKTRQFYSGRTDFPEWSAFRASLYGSTFTDAKFPSATGLITEPRGDSRPRLLFEAIAAPGKSISNSDRVPLTFNGSAPSFSHLNEANGIGFLTGQSAFGSAPPFPSFRAEAADALTMVDEILKSSGRSAANILFLGLYLTPAASSGPDFQEIIEEVASYLGEGDNPAPVISCVGVEGLAWETLNIEIEAIVGPGGASRTLIGTGEQECALGRVPGGANVARCGPIVVCGASGAKLDAAAASLRAAVAEAGGVADGPLITAWHAGLPLDGPQIAAALRRDFPGAHVSVLPMNMPAGGSAVTLELIGNCIQS